MVLQRVGDEEPAAREINSGAARVATHRRKALKPAEHKWVVSEQPMAASGLEAPDGSRARWSSVAVVGRLRDVIGATDAAGIGTRLDHGQPARTRGG